MVAWMACALVSVNRDPLWGPAYGPESAMPKNCLLMLTLQCGCAAALGAAVALVMPSRPAAPAATATAAPIRAAGLAILGINTFPIVPSSHMAPPRRTPPCAIFNFHLRSVSP